MKITIFLKYSIITGDSENEDKDQYDIESDSSEEEHSTKGNVQEVKMMAHT